MTEAARRATPKRDVALIGRNDFQNNINVRLQVLATCASVRKRDRQINPGPPAQRFMKPPLSRYIALAQRRTMVLMSRRGPLLEKTSFPSNSDEFNREAANRGP